MASFLAKFVLLYCSLFCLVSIFQFNYILNHKSAQTWSRQLSTLLPVVHKAVHSLLSSMGVLKDKQTNKTPLCEIICTLSFYNICSNEAFIFTICCVKDYYLCSKATAWVFWCASYSWWRWQRYTGEQQFPTEDTHATHRWQNKKDIPVSNQLWQESSLISIIYMANLAPKLLEYSKMSVSLPPNLPACALPLFRRNLSVATASKPRLWFSPSSQS